jgi:hypothetical protein
VTDRIEQGTLKIVSGWSPSRSLQHVLETSLTSIVGHQDIRSLGTATFIVHTLREPEALRDALARLLNEGEELFVAEFERWSSYGLAFTDWLLRRGH